MSCIKNAVIVHFSLAHPVYCIGANTSQTI